MINKRTNGILCHISSLPSSYGIGDLGPQAYYFADQLAGAGQAWWQILPLSPTDNALGNSPYSSFSTFALNPLFISPELLVADGFLVPQEIERLQMPSSALVDFERIYTAKSTLIDLAFGQFHRKGVLSGAFEIFCRDHAWWLDDFAFFVVIKRMFDGACWADWPAEFRDRHPAALSALLISKKIELMKAKFAQFLVYDQWRRLKEHCNNAGLGIIGDIPIYVNYDGVDVWVHPELFKLDAQRRQTFVAGVPPDYFSEEGQRWGNPVYDWTALRASGFSWWVDRVNHNITLFDSARIDHFRAFVQCWEIPAVELTAVKGAWRDVPGMELFSVLKARFNSLPIIAEDLGIITPDVDALKDHFEFPGMRVVMFAFHNEYKKSRDLPVNYEPCAVVYTGTHDNNTVLGWFDEDMTELEKLNFYDYFKTVPERTTIHQRMMSMAMGSVANICIIQLQDLLGLGSMARMNRPSTAQGNWRWRFEQGAVSPGALAYLRQMTLLSGRSVIDEKTSIKNDPNFVECPPEGR